MAAPCIKLDPPSLTFGEKAIAHVIKVKLDKAPTKPVGVFYSSPSLRFEKCMLKFTPQDWNKEQELVVSPSPFLAPSEGKERPLLIDFITSSQDANFHRKEHKYSLTRSGDAGSLCSGSGDPHYRNFGGRGFDFMGQGTFYYVKSKYLTVMSQLRCPSFNRGVTISTAIAVRFGKSRWIFGVNSGERMASQNLDGITVERSPNGNNFRLAMNDGATVQINKNYWTQGEWYLDITVTLPLHYKDRVSGICGNIGKQDWIRADGAVTGDVNQMGNSYAVPKDDDIFQCARRKPTGEWVQCKDDCELKVTGQFRTCQIPNIPKTITTDPNANGAYGDTSGYVVDPSKAPGEYKGEDGIPFQAINEDALEAVDPLCEIQARELCNAIILHPLAIKYVKADDIIRNCAFDSCAIRPNYVESWKQNYYTLLFELSKSLLNDKNTARRIRLDVAKITLFLGLNGRKPQVLAEQGQVQFNCENKGHLTPIGCTCPEPFTGKYCKERYDNWQKKRR